MALGNEFIGSVEQLLITDVLKSKNLFRFSKEDYLSYSFMFEKQVKEMFNSSGVILFPSATVALFTFLKTLNLDKKSEVIIPPFSWVADYSALLSENIKIRLCQIDENMQITTDSVRELINENTKIVLIPHLMGRGQQQVDEISKLCNEREIVLIEDIAQSFGVKIKNRYAGTFGDFSFSSLNHHKILSTGDGGFGIINSNEKYREMCQIHDQGCLIDNIGKRKVVYENYNKGSSLRINNLTGSIALAQLARFSFIKLCIIDKYKKVINILNKKKKQTLININKGDIPYTALLKSAPNRDYPSLLESGWHYIENIPFFKKMDLSNIDKQNIKKSKTVIASTYAIGTGFIDKYYAIKEGIKINEEINEEIIEKIVHEI